MSKRTIEITIVDDSNKQGCTAECGMDWSSEEALTLASQRIKERFGAKAEFRCLDMAKVKDDQATLEWRKLIKDRNLPLPLLLLNGHPRISGEFDIRQLLDAVEAEMEMGG